MKGCNIFVPNHLISDLIVVIKTGIAGLVEDAIDADLECSLRCWCASQRDRLDELNENSVFKWKDEE